MGMQALQDNTTGMENIALGRSSLASLSSGSDNIAIGRYSGEFIRNGGNGNIHIGTNYVPFASPELDNVIAIGHKIRPNTTTGMDNVILLGHDNNGTQDAPKIGVGTYKPQAKMHVKGSIIVGNDTNTCNSNTEGAIRYDKPSKKFQGCDGTNWVNLN